uniref:C2H2-type domain-containing protein n=1 Tax=viral metagenome TaxID=1070528 RepID=A0A6C0CA26_9ZZZZ
MSREAHNAYMRERIICDKCGGHYTRVNKLKHMKTKSHKENTNDVEELKMYLEELMDKHDKKIKKIKDNHDKEIERLNRQLKNM